MFTTSLLLSPPFSAAVLRSPQPLLSFPSFKLNHLPPSLLTAPSPNPFRVRSDEFDGDFSDPFDSYDFPDLDVEDINDNLPDLDITYGPLDPVDEADPTFLQTQGSVSDEVWDLNSTVVDYRIDEDDFHKISLLECDFFIRKHPDPDDDVYDFSEMYVTPPDMDVYSIPKVLAPMPQKFIRCAATEYVSYNVTEPPIDGLRDPLYKSEKEVLKVFLTKHYGNRRLKDPDFMLDFEEIYVIDSRTKSITRGKVVVTAPGGKDRDRKDDLLVIRDNGTSFKIIHKSEKRSPTEVIEGEDWEKGREAMEKHLRKLRDFDKSNWI